MTTAQRAMESSGQSQRAGLGDGISAHSFRHTFASLLIIGLKYDPVSVSKQLGHKKSSFTSDTYAHLFDRIEHESELRDKLEQSFGHLLDGNTMTTDGGNRPQLRARRNRSNRRDWRLRRHSPQPPARTW